MNCSQRLCMKRSRLILAMTKATLKLTKVVKRQSPLLSLTWLELEALQGKVLASTARKV